MTGGRRKEGCKLKSTASDHAVGSRDTGVVVAEQQQLVQNTVQADDIHVDAYSKRVVLDDQSSQCDSTTRGTVNLQVKVCTHVAFELRDNTSGVRYAVNGGIEPARTPVVRRKSCRKRSYDNTATCPADESSDEELNTIGVRQVTYRKCDGMPGDLIAIWLYSVRWTPISPNPVVPRTRARSKR